MDWRKVKRKKEVWLPAKAIWIIPGEGIIPEGARRKVGATVTSMNKHSHPLFPRMTIAVI